MNSINSHRFIVSPPLFLLEVSYQWSQSLFFLVACRPSLADCLSVSPATNLVPYWMVFFCVSPFPRVYFQTILNQRLRPFLCIFALVACLPPFSFTRRGAPQLVFAPDKPGCSPCLAQFPPFFFFFPCLSPLLRACPPPSN